MHYLYILYSVSRDVYYTGETLDMELRLEQHNSSGNRTSYTRVANDWEVKLLFECNNRSDALYLEAFIKRMKSRRFIKRVITSSTILEDILSKR